MRRSDAQTSTLPPEWGAERTIAPAEVCQWLADEGVDVDSAELVGEGFDNFVFAAGDLYVRAVRRAMAVPDVRKEVRLLPTLQDLQLAVPNPIVVPAQLATVPWPWFAYRPLRGREFGQTLSQPVDGHVTAARLGAFMRQLHTPERAALVSDFVGGDEFRRTDIPYRVEQARLRVDQLAPRFPEAPISELHALIDAAQGIGVLTGSTLVHGDLHFRHVLVDGDGVATGVIDWGDAHIGHPAVDLHACWSLRPEERAVLLQAYGGMDDVTSRASRLIAIYIGAVLALSARDFGLPEVEAAALLALRRTCA